jgi:hypothetical protein
MSFLYVLLFRMDRTIGMNLTGWVYFGHEERIADKRLERLWVSARWFIGILFSFFLAKWRFADFEGQLNIKLFNSVLVVHMQVYNSQICVFLLFNSFFACIFLDILAVNRVKVLFGVKDKQVFYINFIVSLKWWNPARVL